jgi:spermidine synthase
LINEHDRTRVLMIGGGVFDTIDEAISHAVQTRLRQWLAARK